MIRVNLIREDTARRPRRSLMPSTGKVEQVGLGIFAVGALTLGGWYWILDAERSAVKDEMGVLQQRIVELKVKRAQVDQFQQQRLQLQERIQTIENLTARRQGPVGLMNQVMASMPEEPRLWLTLMEERRGHLMLEGRSFDVHALADFIAALSHQRRVSSVELERWEEIGDLVTFNLTCELRPPGELETDVGARLTAAAASQDEASESPEDQTTQGGL